MRVCLDPGHGGRYLGAVREKGKYLEKNLNLELAKEIGKQLERDNHFLIWTREDDRIVYNRKRAEIANTCRNEVFISVHHNAHGTESANGFEVLHWPRSRKGRPLAEKICDLVCEYTPIRNRGPKPRSDLIVIRETRMPAILIEAGFISSPIDLRNFLSDSKRNKFHQTVAKAVKEALNEIF